MKKLLLASAVAALSVTAANAAPTVYGKAFLTLDAVSQDGTDGTDRSTRTALNSNSSRIGLKGGEALTANTDLIYQLEYGIDVDAGSVAVDANGRALDEEQKSQQFYARDTYLGLANAQFGTIMAGRLSAIDGEVDFANVASGGVVGGDGVLTTIDAPRANNTFAYASPNYNGMQVFAMYTMDENNASDTFNRDVFGLAAKYEQGPMRVGASYIGAGNDSKVLRASGGYDISPMISVGALYQLTDRNTNNNENTFTISGEMKTATPWVVYAQGDRLMSKGGIKNDDWTRVLVGGKYNFNQAAVGHVYGGYLTGSEPNQDTKNTFGVGGGIEYKF